MAFDLAQSFKDNPMFREERKHAVLSASGSAMWLACPPSARLNEAEPEETSEYAQEGTLGHAMTETNLLLYLGEIGLREYTQRMEEHRAHRLYSDGLAIAASICVNKGKQLIEEARAAHPDALILLEQRLDFSTWVPEGFGTGDLVIVTPTYVQTVDWKFGQGEWVEAANNSQLRLYAAAALAMYGVIYGSTEVRATVVQPRVNNIDTEILSAADLLRWMEDAVQPAAQLAWRGEGDFKPGHKQCRWCKVRGKCRARAEANLALAQEEFRQPALLTDDELAALYPKLDELIMWAQDAQHTADKRVLAGANLPGLKAVEGRSSRVITDTRAAFYKLIDADGGGFAPEDVALPLPTEPQLLPLSHLEKRVGAARLKEILGDLIVKPPGRLIVVPSDDKRVAVDMTAATADEDFAGMTE